MKSRVIFTVVILASISITQGIPFGQFDSASVSEYQPAELKREKRTLTTICVEIKPSSPYEEPYFMCKGTDASQFSKGGSYNGGQSSSYPSKTSYNPKPSEYGESDSYHSGVKSDYHAPLKSDYHSEPVKYDKPAAYESGSDYSAPSKPSYNKKPSYSDHESHSAYSDYEAPKPSYSTKPSYESHDSHDHYSKPVVHKPSSDYASSYESKPQSYKGPSYNHGEPSEYSKTSSYEHSSPYESKPSYNEGSQSKPSYGSSSSYSPPHESKPTYSKASSYSKPASYEHTDHSSYPPSKSSYSEHTSSKSYSKPTHDHPSSYSKPAYSPKPYSSPSYAPPTHSSSPYSSGEYSKPEKVYGSSEKGYGSAPPKPGYRAMTEDLTQPMWEGQRTAPPLDGFGYRSMDIPMEYYSPRAMNPEIPMEYYYPRAMNPEQQQYPPLDGPVRVDIPANELDAPTLQSPYVSSTYMRMPSYGDVPTTSYDPVVSSPSAGPYAPSYTSSVQSYAPSAPSYTPPSYAPSYAPPTSSYSASVPYTPYVPASYAPANPLYEHPACPKSYFYSLQPAIISLPCVSTPPTYGPSTYGQPLGSPANQNLGEPPHQLYPEHQDDIARSEGHADSGKHIEEHPKPIEDKKLDTQNKTSHAIPKTEAPKKTEIPEEKPVEKKPQDPKVGADKPNEEQRNSDGAGPKGGEGSDTQVAYEAMMRMAKIAAQLKKDDSDPGNGSVGGSGVDRH